MRMGSAQKTVRYLRTQAKRAPVPTTPNPSAEYDFVAIGIFDSRYGMMSGRRPRIVRRIEQRMDGEMTQNVDLDRRISR